MRAIYHPANTWYGSGITLHFRINLYSADGFICLDFRNAAKNALFSLFACDETSSSCGRTNLIELAKMRPQRPVRFPVDYKNTYQLLIRWYPRSLSYLLHQEIGVSHNQTKMGTNPPTSLIGCLQASGLASTSPDKKDQNVETVEYNEMCSEKWVSHKDFVKETKIHRTITTIFDRN